MFKQCFRARLFWLSHNRLDRQPRQLCLQYAMMLPHLELHCRTGRYIRKLCLPTFSYSVQDISFTKIYVSCFCYPQCQQVRYFSTCYCAWFFVRTNFRGGFESSMFFVAYKPFVNSSYNPHEKNSTNISSPLRFAASREASLSWIKIQLAHEDS